ncbi:hypothetical protein ACNKHV_11860 [Shigella flexneri]
MPHSGPDIGLESNSVDNADNVANFLRAGGDLLDGVVMVLT